MGRLGVGTAIDLKKPIVAMAVEGVSKAALPDPIRGKDASFYSWGTGSLGSYRNNAKTVK